MTYTKSTPPARLHGRRNTALKSFKQFLHSNPGEWYEYDEIVTYNLPSKDGITFSCRAVEGSTRQKPLFKVWGRFDPITAETV